MRVTALVLFASLFGCTAGLAQTVTIKFRGVTYPQWPGTHSDGIFSVNRVAGTSAPISGSITIDTAAFLPQGMQTNHAWHYWAGANAVTITLVDAGGSLTNTPASAALALCDQCTIQWTLNTYDAASLTYATFQAYAPSLTVGPGSVLFSPLATPKGYSYFDGHIDAGDSLGFSWDEITSASISTVPEILGVGNGASGLGGIAPATWVSIYGRNLSPTRRSWATTDFDGMDLPRELDGVGVQVNGKPGFVSYVSPGQINVLMPDDDLSPQFSLQVTKAAETSAVFTGQKAKLAPAFFQLAPDVLLDKSINYIAAVHSDGVVVGFPGMFYRSVTRAAKRGEVISLYGTGFGITNPPSPASRLVGRPCELDSTVTVRIAGAQAEVLWAGLVGPGLYQFNIRVPHDAPWGDALVTAQVAGIDTQPRAYIRIDNL